MARSGNNAREFAAMLERTGDRLNWTVVRVPLDVHKIWGKRGQLRVQGTINGFAFRSSLFPDGKGSHFMMVNKKMQAGAGVQPGKKAQFRLEPDRARREVTTPEELMKVLKQSRRLKKFYESFSDSYRRYMCQWVGEGKHGETRVRRAEQLAERLMLTMEAEQELPPVLHVALAGNPLAREGWERMPATHRRFHLMGIFGYRNPESQARRVAKAMEEMVAYGKKPSRKPSTDADDAGES